MNISNARIAQLINTPVLLVTGGGLRNVVDRLAMILPMFTSITRAFMVKLPSATEYVPVTMPLILYSSLLVNIPAQGKFSGRSYINPFGEYGFQYLPFMRL